MGNQVSTGENDDFDEPTTQNSHTNKKGSSGKMNKKHNNGNDNNNTSLPDVTTTTKSISSDILSRYEVMRENAMYAKKFVEIEESGKFDDVEDIEREAMDFSDAEMEQVKREAQEELERLKRALHDPVLFKQYFFDDRLTAIFQLIERSFKC
eukprot:GEZU01022843.1.p1 GENE.GEZU01022843.1~~GEZU01022843.1.p1  ORF type:complete len:152 (+),score=46.87 GEZU01022843.1:60-515(+)